MPCGGKIRIPGQGLVDRVEASDGDGHLSRLQMQETGFVQNISQVLWQEWR